MDWDLSRWDICRLGMSDLGEAVTLMIGAFIFRFMRIVSGFMLHLVCLPFRPCL